MLRVAGNIWLVFVLFVLLCSPALGAQVYGGIYDKDANSISKTEVFINSTPPQRHISRYGGYSFEVGEGSYRIVANLTQNNVTRTIATQDIKILRDGEYRIDLSVDESIDFEADFVPVPWWQQLWWVWVSAGVLILVFSIILVIHLTRSRRVEEPQLAYEVKTNHQAASVDIAPAIKEEEAEVNVDATVAEAQQSAPVAVQVQHETQSPLHKRILVFLKKEGGSVTQKQIRKQLPFSSAKVSMVLTELEKQGTIVKQKKGRVNIIVLAK